MGAIRTKAADELSEEAEGGTCREMFVCIDPAMMDAADHEWLYVECVYVYTFVTMYVYKCFITYIYIEKRWKKSFYITKPLQATYLTKRV